MSPETLDHVALWVADRDPIADFVTSRVGMHVVDRTDAFTLVGSDARRGKLTLFEAEGPRERRALQCRSRVSRLDDALRDLGASRPSSRARGRGVLRRPRRLRLGLVEALTDVEYDLDHAALSSHSPEQTARATSSSASSPSRVDRAFRGGGRRVRRVPRGRAGRPGAPPLNHPAVLVDSADQHIEEARELGIEIADIVDAANTYAVFVWGPERVKVEYVEHKPTFSLT